MLYICAKFLENILNGIKVMERTRMINRGRMDGQTDGHSKHNTLPFFFGGGGGGGGHKKILNTCGHTAK